MSGLFGITMPSQQQQGDGALPNPTTGELPNGEQMQTQSTIFDEAVKARNGGDDAETETEEKATEDLVELEDGTKVTKEEYIAKREADVAAKEARLDEREQWLRPRDDQGQNDQNGQGEDDPNKPPDPIQWQPFEIDQETLDDNEVAVRQQMNGMGEQFTGIINTLRTELHEANTKIADTDRMTREHAWDREVSRVQAEHGVTNEEVMAVHREFPNTFDVDALALIAKSRKAETESKAEDQTQTRQERNDALSKVGGASNERGASREEGAADRKSKITDWTDGRQIAQHYKGLIPA